LSFLAAPAALSRQWGRGRGLRCQAAEEEDCCNDIGSTARESGLYHGVANPDMHNYRVLPRRIILIRHGESEGNIDETAYTRIPDPQIKLTEKGKEQAFNAGRMVKELLDKDREEFGIDSKVFFYVSPYRRSKETCVEIAKHLDKSEVMGIREEVQLREQDFGNFQDRVAKVQEKTERNLYGRFYYRFPNGESGADVYDRVTMFEDHMVRDIDGGRFPEGANLVLVSHGLTIRVFLARWFHWTVKEFEDVWNPPNSAPLVMERRSLNDELADTCSIDGVCDPFGESHTKDLYQLTQKSQKMLGGCNEEMCTMILPEDSWQRTLECFEDEFGHWDSLRSGIFDDVKFGDREYEYIMSKKGEGDKMTRSGRRQAEIEGASEVNAARGEGILD